MARRRRRTQWWSYCEQHLFNHSLWNGRVCSWQLVREADPLVCGGRNHDDKGRAVGAVCGERFGPKQVVVSGVDVWWARMETRLELAARARVKGWAVPDGANHAPPMCPACRGPQRWGAK